MKIVLSLLLGILISLPAHNQIIKGKINIKIPEKDFSKVQGMCSYTEINNKQVETIRTFITNLKSATCSTKCF